jgi:hypothetical protein
MSAAKRVLEIASDIHNKSKLAPTTARGEIPGALAEVAKLRRETKRQDVVAFCDSASAYLDSIGRNNSYSGAFSGGLDALSRRASEIGHEEPSDLTTLREENDRLKTELAALKLRQPQ